MQPLSSYPFLDCRPQNIISRDLVKLMIERNAVAGKSMPKIAGHLKAVRGDINGD